MARQILDCVSDQVADGVAARMTVLGTGAAIAPDDPPTDREFGIAMTYEEWRTWLPGGSPVTDWFDGEVPVPVPGSEPHEDMIGFLCVLLSWSAPAEGLAKVIHVPFAMRVSARQTREPDLVFVTGEHADRLDGKRLEGVSGLAIEIVSPNSVTCDKRDELEEYARLGVREYRTFDARPGLAESRFYRRSAEGRIEPATPKVDGRYHAAPLTGFWLGPTWLWQEPMSDPVALLPAIASEAWHRTLAAIESA